LTVRERATAIRGHARDLLRRGLRRGLSLLIPVLALVAASIYAGHDEPRLIIIGDSLSTTHESWPNFLRKLAPRWNIHLLAQNGRTIRDYDPPRDLWTPGDKPETVVYFLGTNDVLQRDDVIFATYRLKNHISFLLDRNFRVLLINLPRFNFGDAKFAANLAAHRALIDSFRDTNPRLYVYDLDRIWDSKHAPDGIHPDAELSQRIAVTLDRVLAEKIY